MGVGGQGGRVARFQNLKGDRSSFKTRPWSSNSGDHVKSIRWNLISRITKILRPLGRTDAFKLRLQSPEAELFGNISTYGPQNRQMSATSTLFYKKFQYISQPKSNRTRRTRAPKTGQ